jgi:hypothetical protein
MSEMIEQVARGLAAATHARCSRDRHGDEVSADRKAFVDENWRIYVGSARVAIDAMREPTGPMRKAFVDLALHGDVLSHGGWDGYARDQWQTMIDAALKL